jgi:predicted nucleic acid-binding Zn ribbon protein
VRGRTEAIGDILGRLFERKGWGKRVFEGRALSVWGDVVGKSVKAHSRPVRVKDGKMIVAVDDSVWKQEISFLSEEIIWRINERMGREVVREIVLVVR